MLTHANIARKATARPQVRQFASFRRNPVIQQLLGSARVQPKLRVGAVNDPAEAEADRVADRVMRMPEPVNGGVDGGKVQRKCATCEEEAQRKPAETIRRMEEEEELQMKPAKQTMQRSPEISNMIRLSQSADGAAALAPSTEGAIRGLGNGAPLPASERSFFEPRFGRDLSGVRIHSGGKADEASRSINARAFTLGSDITFARGEYRPGTGQGRRLLAHELTHTVQQERALTLRRRWDRATTECAGQPATSSGEQQRWINVVQIDQTEPQTITLHWTDGTEETHSCSTGKGHCCVDSVADPASCEGSTSRVNGSNCTPITTRNGYPIKHRDLDHNGISFWSEFVPPRGIAMHTYDPMDGTPLSHGCVRLRHQVAKKIFCNVRQNQTMVKVANPARPLCGHTNLQTEWLSEFSTAAMPLDGEALDMQRAIRESRRIVRESFGREPESAELTAMTAADIPRCRVQNDPE